MTGPDSGPSRISDRSSPAWPFPMPPCWRCSGSRDESLRTAEDLLDADVHVRGNEITLTGTPADVAFAERVFTELITLAERGQQVSIDAVRRTVEMLADDDAEDRARIGESPGRGAQPGHPVPAREDDPAQDAQPEALRRRDRRAHHRLRDRPGRYRQDLPGHGQGRAGAAGQDGQPDHPDPAGGGGGGAARVPARHPLREDRPVPAPALRRAARHDRPGVDPEADGRRHHRGRTAGLHARSHA